MVVEARVSTVRTALRRYGVSEPEIERLLRKHHAILGHGERLLSSADYVAREILEADNP